ncbi:hypothetical protein I551_8173 [Mycobacterium ulcerans str. Harvey]|uniref:Uncharacterized protein n=1 Tax=Mycobacterium ulcerans str. Harvey TaxID=1299332 RepID=A0ABN0QL95_MYCUL|nr:hypothetical protein I551_8173 [Mycobacterium ulcerans str. Harvey]
MRWCCRCMPRVDHREISAHFAHIYDAAVSRTPLAGSPTAFSRR